MNRFILDRADIWSLPEPFDVTGYPNTSPLLVQSGLALAFMAILIVAGQFPRRYVELPAQRPGLRITARKTPTPA